MVPGNTGVDGLPRVQREALHDGNSSAKMGIPSKFEDRWATPGTGRPYYYYFFLRLRCVHEGILSELKFWLLVMKICSMHPPLRHPLAMSHPLKEYAINKAGPGLTRSAVTSFFAASHSLLATQPAIVCYAAIEAVSVRDHCLKFARQKSRRSLPMDLPGSPPGHPS